MRFLYLCESEIERVKVRWSDNHTKSPEVIDSALLAGFTYQEIEQSPLGILEEDLRVSGTETARAGAIVLTGINGSMLFEMRE